MNREILRIALPAIIANIAVPLLGLLDTAIAGHLGAAKFIGAAAVGATMLNVIYWHFEFLRMGTSGMTAQALGAGSRERQAQALQRSIIVAAALSFIILVLLVPLRSLALWIISPSQEVRLLAEQYFTIAIWGAPAVLITMSLKGWLLGRQDSRSPMSIAIVINVLNIIVSLVAVYVLRLGFIGIALGTLVAVWVGLFYSLWLVFKRHSEVAWLINLRQSGGESLVSRRFFRVNADIFIRSFFMMAVMLFFTSAGARSGDIILAVNSMMMQLFLFYSYFMDGFAFAGEAIVGKYYGADDVASLKRCVNRLMLWGAAITIPFSLAYALFPYPIFTTLTSLDDVAQAALHYRWWCAAVPLMGMAAFVWDGVYVGLTHTRGMLIAVAAAAIVFFSLFYTLPQSWVNHRLWMAFITFLALRSLIQTILYPSHIRRHFHQ